MWVSRVNLNLYDTVRWRISSIGNIKKEVWPSVPRLWTILISLPCPWLLSAHLQCFQVLAPVKRKLFHRLFSDLVGFYLVNHELHSTQSGRPGGTLKSCTKQVICTDQSKHGQRSYTGSHWLVKARLIPLYGANESLGAGSDNLWWAGKCWLVHLGLPFLGLPSIET